MHEMNMYANAMPVMTWYEMHENENNTRRQGPEPEKKKKYNLTPETARVEVQVGKKIHLGRYNTPPLRKDLAPRSRTERTPGTQNGGDPRVPR